MTSYLNNNLSVIWFIQQIRFLILNYAVSNFEYEYVVLYYVYVLRWHNRLYGIIKLYLDLNIIIIHYIIKQSLHYFSIEHIDFTQWHYSNFDIITTSHGKQVKSVNSWKGKQKLIAREYQLNYFFLMNTFIF